MLGNGAGKEGGMNDPEACQLLLSGRDRAVRLTVSSHHHCMVVY